MKNKKNTSFYSTQKPQRVFHGAIIGNTNFEISSKGNPYLKFVFGCDKDNIILSCIAFKDCAEKNKDRLKHQQRAVIAGYFENDEAQRNNNIVIDSIVLPEDAPQIEIERPKKNLVPNAIGRGLRIVEPEVENKYKVYTNSQKTKWIHMDAFLTERLGAAEYVKKIKGFLTENNVKNLTSGFPSERYYNFRKKLIEDLIKKDTETKAEEKEIEKQFEFDSDFLGIY